MSDTAKITLRNGDSTIEVELEAWADKNGVCDALFISLKGYECNEGGHPIILGMRNGNPRIAIWTDINKRNPTHDISLKDAHKSLRK